MAEDLHHHSHHNPLGLGDYAIASLLFTVLVLALLVPLYFYLKPSPKRYLDFIFSTFNVRVHDDAGGLRFRWMPHYWTAVFISFFIGQAVQTTLHYPLLEALDASVLQMGLLDAVSSMVATVADVALRSNPRLWGRLSRSRAFLYGAILNVIGYSVINGLILPRLDNNLLSLFAVFCSQTLTGLHLTFQEFAVMRNDWNEDIVAQIDTLDRSSKSTWTSEESGLKLAQLMVVCRYPATVMANLTIGKLVVYKSDICMTYLILGLMSAVQGIWLAWTWSKHTARKVAKKSSSVTLVNRQTSKTSLTKAPLADMSPGGAYFRMALNVAIYNAVLEVTRKGYVRLLNLTVLTTDIVADQDLSVILTLTFLVSWMFFWMADISSSEVPSHVQAAYGNIRRTLFFGYSDTSVITGKMIVGIVSFILMSLGHFLMGFARGFYGLMVSAVFFGLGQATSTGLRTVIKDDIRILLRNHDQEESYEKRFMRILNGYATAFTIISSLIVGCVGDYGTLQLASYFYAAVAILGVPLAVVSNTAARKAHKFKADSLRSAGLEEVCSASGASLDTTREPLLSSEPQSSSTRFID